MSSLPLRTWIGDEIGAFHTDMQSVRVVMRILRQFGRTDEFNAFLGQPQLMDTFLFARFTWRLLRFSAFIQDHLDPLGRIEKRKDRGFPLGAHSDKLVVFQAPPVNTRGQVLAQESATCPQQHAEQG